MSRPEPTESELRNAWSRSRRADWPDTYEEAMADSLLSRLVRMNAMHPPRAHRAPAPAVAAAKPARAASAPPPPLPTRRIEPGFFDRKRAASGERADD